MASKGVLDFTLDDEELKFQADAAKGPTPVPVGWYNVLITDVSIAPWSKDEPINPKTKKPVREKLVLTVKLSEGEFAGRIRYVNVPLFQKFNPTAKSPAGTATVSSRSWMRLAQWTATVLRCQRGTSCSARKSR